MTEFRALESSLARTSREGPGERTRRAVACSPRVQPLIRPAPRSTMFFPLVVLVAILPGLVALNSWDLTPPGPLWGLRALAVLDGMAVDQVPAASEVKPISEAAALRTVCFQPPLYAWLAALGMQLSSDRDPIASVLPSYIAGVIVVMLIYFHGRLWRGGGLGLAAALLIGFNPSLLLRMQEATPMTLALAGAIGALLCYGWYLRAANDLVRPWPWATPLLWAALGGVSLGLSLLTLNGFGLLVMPIVLLHQVYLWSSSAAASRPATRPRHKAWKLSFRYSPGWIDGLFALLIAALMVLLWYVQMFRLYGWEVLSGFEFRLWGIGGEEASLVARLFEIAPVTLPLGLYGAARAIRLALIDENNTPETVGGSLWVIWLAVAALMPSLWPGGPRVALDLLLLAPLTLLAALTIADLVNRRIPVRKLIGLAPATAMTVAWWASGDLRGSVNDLIHGRASAATALGVHLAFDLVLASIWFTRRLDVWAQGRDDRQRQVLAFFLLTILAITVLSGIREVVFRHGETHDLLALRTMILRRDRDRPFELLAVVGPEPPAPRAPSADPPDPRVEPPFSGGWLRFVLRTALPGLPQRDLTSIDDLLSLPEGQRLIIFAGSGQRLSYPIKSKLGLEAIHPGRSGILDAYATANSRPARR